MTAGARGSAEGSRRSKTRRWLAPLLGALFGATWIPAAFLLDATDEGRWNVSPWLDSAIAYYYFLVSAPGMLFPGHGTLTLAVMIAFWAAAFAGLARLIRTAWRHLAG